jgi:hydrophobic/amphiphilic exporter-1 (mainly G- bacteria), HAE1 family
VNAAKGIRQMMAQLKERFPSGLDYSISLDTTLAVTAGMEEIYKTLAEAMLLVIIVVFVFLQGWRATLIPLCAVPVSLVGTFAVFPLLGFSVNTLSLLGLVLAIGFVVDDAIVVVEAVEHHIELGLAPKDAARSALRLILAPGSAGDWLGQRKDPARLCFQRKIRAISSLISHCLRQRRCNEQRLLANK